MLGCKRLGRQSQRRICTGACQGRHDIWWRKRTASDGVGFSDQSGGDVDLGVIVPKHERDRANVSPRREYNRRVVFSASISEKPLDHLARVAGLRDAEVAGHKVTAGMLMTAAGAAVVTPSIDATATMLLMRNLAIIAPPISSPSLGRMLRFLEAPQWSR